MGVQEFLCVCVGGLGRFLGIKGRHKVQRACFMNL